MSTDSNVNVPAADVTRIVPIVVVPLAETKPTNGAGWPYPVHTTQFFDVAVTVKPQRVYAVSCR